MATRLFFDASRSINDHEREIRRRCTGGHVGGVLNVAGTIGDDELALRGGGVAIGHVNGDALLALSTEPIGDETQVHFSNSTVSRSARYRINLVVKELLRVKKQAANNR